MKLLKLKKNESTVSNRKVFKPVTNSRVRTLNKSKFPFSEKAKLFKTGIETADIAILLFLILIILKILTQ